MPVEPRWLTADEVAELNRYIVEDTGEPFRVRDRGLLEGACARPVNLHAYEGVSDVLCLALTLMWGVARNHPFEQGNKRAGFEAAVIFLAINGYELDVPDAEYLAKFIVEVIAHRQPEEAVERVLRPYLRVVSTAEEPTEP